MVRGRLRGQVGVCSREVERIDSMLGALRGDGESATPSSILPIETGVIGSKSNDSRSGVREGRTVRQHWPSQAERPPAPGVNFKTRSVQRWKRASETCRRHPTASRNINSFWLISRVFRPEILLHARAE
jgi:hypothetical protein